MAANVYQQQAINVTSGPVLIIAGPGSGKTFTLVQRIVNLITSGQATPESLMVSTFTDKAARELMTRISNRLLDLGLEFNHSEMLIGTFHSICLRLVEENREFTRLKRSFTLIRSLFNQFLHFLRSGGINEFEDDSEYAPSGCVSFMTIHQSKGLEFPVVLVSSLHAVPRSQHTDIDTLLEESELLTKPPYEPLENTKFYDFRRLFYTAFSRAQNLLVLADQKRTSRGSGTSPSKYFRDIVDELPSWRDDAFDLSKIEFEPVKTINLKKEYSFTSHITVFETCPEQYRFFRELEFNPIRQAPQLFGTLVHQTIEDMHKAVLRGEESKITTKNIEDWFQSNYTNLIQREKTYLAEPAKKAALKQVLHYYDRERKNWDRIKEAEVELSLVKDHYILTGSVDLIRGEDNTVEIVDFKTEKKPDMEKDKDRLQLYARQLKVYAHLVEEKTGHPVSKMHLYYTGEESGNPYVTFPKDTKSINDTIVQFDQTVSRIEAKDYTMHARPVRLCENCDMRFYCDFKETKVKSGKK